MIDRPIIFSGPMVRALLDGRKTMTRQTAWVLPKTNNCRSAGESIDRGGFAKPSLWQKVKPGDRLWVRENFAYVGSLDPGFLVYQATYPAGLPKDAENVPPDIHDAGYRWTPCIHMPRALSRLTLVVTATKIERLRDISNADAKAEGIYLPGAHELYTHDPAVRAGNNNGRTPEGAFKNLWCKINGPDSWADNPEVVALTFSVLNTNIDERAWP